MMQKVFEKIIERLEEYPTYSFGVSLLNTEEYIKVSDLVEIVNQVAKEYGGGWIPVSERLPEIKQEVLITADDNAVYQGVMANGGFIIFEDGWIDIKHVLAWRELPEPYKESEE